MTDEHGGATDGGQRVTRGITVTDGSDLRIGPFHIEVNIDTGETTAAPVDVHLRTDMWPYWLAEGIEAVIDVRQYAALIPAAVAADDGPAIDAAMIRELRSSMRAVCAAAFAVDSFYASVKARSPQHPDADRWRTNRTPRHSQVFETFRYHLKLDNATSKETKKRITQLFTIRDAAVHPGSEFKEPVYRPDVNASVDWHFGVFTADNAVACVAMIVQMIDRFEPRLQRGSAELAGFRSKVRPAMDRVLDQYEAVDGLPAIGRAVPPTVEPVPADA
ncbi:hypothetical protein ACWDOP_07880 [Nocardia sp. NPDC003693]